MASNSLLGVKSKPTTSCVCLKLARLVILSIRFSRGANSYLPSSALDFLALIIELLLALDRSAVKGRETAIDMR